MIKNRYKNLFALFLVVALASCKNEPSSVPTKMSSSLNPDEKLENVFEIHLNAKVSYDDEFRVYYTTQKDPNFSENQVVRTKVFGFEEEQTIVYKLPKGDYPTNLRLDFGFNTDQKSIQINFMKFKHSQKQIVVNGAALADYFDLMQGHVVFDKAQNQLDFIQSENYFPIIYANADLKERIYSLPR